MSSPFVGEVRMFGFNFAPSQWALCNGALLPISQNQALFSILGTTYGGNGTTTFGLPNLQGRIPYHWGTGNGGTYNLGQFAGEEFHTLITAEMPLHQHLANAGSAAAPDQGSPAGNLWVAQASNSYASTTTSSMAAGAIAHAGGGQPHENRPPYLVINFCIALTGLFPSRT